MKERVYEYGTEYTVRVDKSDKDMIIVICDEIKEGFVLLYHGMNELPSMGDVGKIVFTKGGPKKGYWKYYG